MPISIKVIGGAALEKIGMLATGAKDNLMKDLVDASSAFGMDAVSIAKKQYLSGPRPDRLGVVSGRLRAGVSTETKQAGSKITTTVGSNVAYAAIHELGGVTHPNVTDRMRRFAWAMFFKTNDEKYKRMALTRKSQLTINIKPRPFLSPSIDDAMPSFQQNIARILRSLDFVGS